MSFQSRGLAALMPPKEACLWRACKEEGSYLQSVM